MREIASVLASAVAGVFQGVSEGGSKDWVRGLTAVLAGISLATTVRAPAVATVFAGMLLGTAMAGRVDKNHRLTIATFFLIYAIVPKDVYVLPLLAATVLGYTDERLRGRRGLLGRRVLLPLALLVTVPWTGWAPAAAVVAYRLGEGASGVICRGKRGS